MYQEKGRDDLFQQWKEVNHPHVSLTYDKIIIRATLPYNRSSNSTGIVLISLKIFNLTKLLLSVQNLYLFTL